MKKPNNCEVSLDTLRRRLAKGEDYNTARKLRNFRVFGKTYKNLWELSKVTQPQLTYGQLVYRVCQMNMTPTKAVLCVRQWVEGKRVTGKATKCSRTANIQIEKIKERYETS